MDRAQRIHELSKENSKYIKEINSKQSAASKKIVNPAAKAQAKLHNFQNSISSFKTKAKRKLNRSASADPDKNKSLENSFDSAESLNILPEKMQKEAKKLVNDYNETVEETVRHIEIANEQFESIEYEHLNKMRRFLQTYIRLMKDSHVRISQTYEQFEQQLEEKSESYLMKKFVASKGTGSKRPMKMNSVNEIFLAPSERNSLKSPASFRKSPQISMFG